MNNCNILSGSWYTCIGGGLCVIYTAEGCIHLYGSCYIDSLKCGAWALTWEWVNALATMVLIIIFFVTLFHSSEEDT